MAWYCSSHERERRHGTPSEVSTRLHSLAAESQTCRTSWPDPLSLHEGLWVQIFPADKSSSSRSPPYVIPPEISLSPCWDTSYPISDVSTKNSTKIPFGYPGAVSLNPIHQQDQPLILTRDCAEK